MKYNFRNDYTTGCHPNILHALIKHNMDEEEGYGEDRFSKKAADLIKEKIQNGHSAVYFVSGGTQANLTIIASILKPFESVIAAETSHIYVHETGAIEATGHRIQTIQSNDGKLMPADIQLQLDKFEEVHTTMPRMVYISNSTEVGTIYSKAELVALSAFCKEKSLILFLDGARLSAALASDENNITWTDLGRYTDVFYIGGTKAGTLLGEAIVINNPGLQENFLYHLKQRGALLAKGRVLGIQFLELFSGNLFYEVGKHANAMAQKIASSISSLGFGFLASTSTNQIFPVLPDKIIEQLQKDYMFYRWKSVNEKESAIRLVTSWSTNEPAVDAFINDLADYARAIL
jgi:threonine aldolase